MTGLPDDEERLLASARRAFAPTASDARRVLVATRAAIAADALAAPPQVGKVAAAGAARLWLQRAALGLIVAALSGALGYRAGLTAGRAERPEPAPQPQPNTATTRDQPPPPVPPTPTAAPASLPAPEPPTAPPPRKPQRPARGDGLRNVENSSAKAASLDEEVEALREVERALRDGDPRRAFELLGDLDRSIPGGRLQEERAAAFVRARCALGLGKGERLAREFAEQYPTSVYLARVQQACAREER